tara:strand:- start:1022 stop:1303 length:282 start_codon:yes stop_codon:yes gene_type:complete
VAVGAAAQRAAPVDPSRDPERHAHPCDRVGGAAVIARVRLRVLTLSAQIGHTLARVTTANAADPLVLRAVTDLEDAARRLAAAVATVDRDGAA